MLTADKFSATYDVPEQVARIENRRVMLLP
jgi:hypothetical protein